MEHVWLIGQAVHRAHLHVRETRLLAGGHSLLAYKTPTLAAQGSLRKTKTWRDVLLPQQGLLLRLFQKQNSRNG